MELSEYNGWENKFKWLVMILASVLHVIRRLPE